MAVSATGVWLDMDGGIYVGAQRSWYGEVVTVEPVNGIQLVAPGGFIDAEATRVIALAEAAYTSAGG